MRIEIAILLLLSLLLSPKPAFAINTVDSATIPPSWAIKRVTVMNVDEQGVTVQLKTGEKIKSILITPARWVQVQPLDGALCKESCSGAAPTSVLINKGDRPASGMSFVTITTNSRNIYKFRVRYGAPSKRTFEIGG